MNIENRRISINQIELPIGMELAKKAIDTANETMLEIYPQLEKNHANLMRQLSLATTFEENVLEKLSLSSIVDRLVIAIDVGHFVASKTLELIPDQIDYDKDVNRALWKELVRNNLPLENSEIVDLPGTKIIARGSELFALLPGKQLDDSLKIGSRFNQGVIEILMEPFLPKFSKKITNLFPVKFDQTDQMFEAKRTLRNSDYSSLVNDRNQLLDAHINSLIPAYIVSSTRTFPFSYPK